MYANLKLQIWRTGIRQNRLAKLLGMDEALLSRIVNGYREPNAEVRAQIAALLHSDEAWLFESVEQNFDHQDTPLSGSEPGRALSSGGRSEES
jgi:transcriptional regulator with XRE-family HTH domain